MHLGLQDSTRSKLALMLCDTLGAVLQPRELRALMAELEPAEVAVAGQAVALSQWHAVIGSS